MQTPTAIVVALSGRMATVTVDAGVACARCAAGNGCGAALLAGDGSTRQLELPVPDELKLTRGDRVSLMLAPRDLLQATLTVYALPLAAMMAAPASAEWLWGPLSDGALLLSAAAGLAGTVAWVRRRLQRNDCLRQLLPRIGSRLPSPERDPYGG